MSLKNTNPKGYWTEKPKRNQMIVVLREIDGLTFREIGDELGISRARVHQIYSKLKKKKNEKM